MYICRIWKWFRENDCNELHVAIRIFANLFRIRSSASKVLLGAFKLNKAASLLALNVIGWIYK